MTLPASPVYPSGAVLVPIPHFRLKSGEPLAVGLKRLSLFEIESSISTFYDGEEVFESAVHEARKATKRIRALLRLVRWEIGERPYTYENAAMRETAKLLSKVRSASVIVAGLEDIRLAYGSLLAEGTLEELAERLEIRRLRIVERAMEDPDLVPRVVENLERAHSRYSSWPTDPQARNLYGIGIRNSYEAVSPGLRHTYRRGRHDMVAAYSARTPTAFHQWRKRTKYLRHQLEILTPLWPEVVLGMAVAVGRVSELLGEDHDLAELLNVVANRPDLCSNPIERSLLKALAEQRRSDLQTACRVLGRRIFAETPKALDQRFSAYWESAELARSLQAGLIAV